MATRRSGACAAKASSRSRLRASMATRYPSRANRLATAIPRPGPTPATRTLPSAFIAFGSPLESKSANDELALGLLNASPHRGRTAGQRNGLPRIDHLVALHAQHGNVL